MSFGLQVLDSSGRVTLDTRDRVAKILAVVDVPRIYARRNPIVYPVAGAHPSDTFCFVVGNDVSDHGTSVVIGGVQYGGYHYNGSSLPYLAGEIKIVVVKY